VSDSRKLNISKSEKHFYKQFLGLSSALQYSRCQKKKKKEENSLSNLKHCTQQTYVLEKSRENKYSVENGHLAFVLTPPFSM